MYTLTPHFQYFLHPIYQKVLVSVYNKYNWNHYILPLISPPIWMPLITVQLLTKPLHWAPSFALVLVEPIFSRSAKVTN